MRERGARGSGGRKLPAGHGPDIHSSLIISSTARACICLNKLPPSLPPPRLVWNLDKSHVGDVSSLFTTQWLPLMPAVCSIRTSQRSH